MVKYNDVLVAQREVLSSIGYDPKLIENSFDLINLNIIEAWVDTHFKYDIDTGGTISTREIENIVLFFQDAEKVATYLLTHTTFMRSLDVNFRKLIESTPWVPYKGSSSEGNPISKTGDGEWSFEKDGVKFLIGNKYIRQYIKEGMVDLTFFMLVDNIVVSRLGDTEAWVDLLSGGDNYLFQKFSQNIQLSLVNFDPELAFLNYEHEKVGRKLSFKGYSYELYKTPDFNILKEVSIMGTFYRVIVEDVSTPKEALNYAFYLPRQVFPHLMSLSKTGEVLDAITNIEVGDIDHDDLIHISYKTYRALLKDISKLKVKDTSKERKDLGGDKNEDYDLDQI